METSLHQRMKRMYADDESQIEQRIGRYIIDVIRGEAQDTPYFTLGLVGPPRTPNVRVAGAWLKPR